MKLQLMFLISITVAARAQWFDKQSLTSTVLIEKWADTSFAPHGTGFVLWNYSNTEYSIVVTAGHLLNRSELYVLANADSSYIRYAQVQKIDSAQFLKLKWVLLDNRLRAKVRLTKDTFLVDSLNDIGIFLIDLPTRMVTEKGDSIRVAHFQSIPRSGMRTRKDVSLGDEAYFVGFPFGLGTVSRLEPVIRSGSVAWISHESNEFLLDAFSFGGNSGSPIFSKIILGREQGTIAWDQAFLFGMIVGHLGDKIEGVIRQPDPRIPSVERFSFESQNWGLARCVWLDQILSLIQRAGTLTIKE